MIWPENSENYQNWKKKREWPANSETYKIWLADNYTCTVCLEIGVIKKWRNISWRLRNTYNLHEWMKICGDCVRNMTNSL